MDAHSNFGYSTITVAPVPANSGTSLTVASGEGALFPAAPFNCTVWPPSVQPLASNAEIVRVTAVVGDVLTITRAQESTTAKSIEVGWQIANTTSVKVFTDIESQVNTNTADIATLQTSKQDQDQALQDISDAAFVQGDLIYRDAAGLTRLPAGVAGQLLETAGPAANPAWVNPPAGGGDLLAANNLSDVANAATSRQNLGLEIGVDVQAQDAVLQDLSDAALVQGDILYYDGSNLVRLAAGTNGHFLQTQGAGANPQWAAGGGGGIDTTEGLFSARPAAGNTGDLYFATDGIVASRDTGAAWSIFGPMWNFTPLVDGDYSWVNQGTSSIVVAQGALHLIGAAATGNIQLRGRTKAAPATPYTVTAALIPSLIGANSYDFGIFFRENATGELSSIAVSSNTPASGTQINSRNWSSPTAISATNAAIVWSPTNVVWLRITDDGTNRLYSYSPDGLNWVQLFSVGRTTFLTADEIGFYVFTNVSASGNNMARATFLSWVQT